MEELLLYQKKIVENEKGMSNEELLDEVLSQASGDDYDGCFTTKGLWEYNYLKSKLRERLANWLSAQQSVHPTCGESAPLPALSTPEADTPAEVLSTPPTSR